jgi:hypothetical protein
MFRWRRNYMNEWKFSGEETDDLIIVLGPIREPLIACQGVGYSSLTCRGRQTKSARSGCVEVVKGQDEAYLLAADSHVSEYRQ